MVSVLSDRQVSIAVALLVTIQQLVVLGRFASAAVPDETIGRIYNSISFVGFDIDFIKPVCVCGTVQTVQCCAFNVWFLCLFQGCTVGRFYYTTIFWITVVVGVCAFLFFVVGSALRTLYQSVYIRRLNSLSVVAGRPTKSFNWQKDFSFRVVHSFVVLLNVLYLQTMIRSFQGIYCVKGDGESRLAVELLTVCYEGTHLYTGVFIWILLFVYGAGFPIACFYIGRVHFSEGTRWLSVGG